MGTNGILNAEGDKDLIVESVIDIAKECVLLGVKDVFVSIDSFLLIHMIQTDRTYFVI